MFFRVVRVSDGSGGPRFSNDSDASVRDGEPAHVLAAVAPQWEFLMPVQLRVRRHALEVPMGRDIQEHLGSRINR